MLPIQITVRNTQHSNALEELLCKKAEKLTHFYDQINSCKVVIHIEQKHQHQGKLFSVSIQLAVPGKDLSVNRQLDEDIYIAIRDAFHAVQRQLASYARKRRGDVKTHHSTIQGRISRLFHSRGFGFIEGVDGNEYYLSDANLRHPTFAQLRQGDIVTFIAASSQEGLQAHRITRITKEKGYYQHAHET